MDVSGVSMYLPSDPKIIQGLAEDELLRRWSFWMPVMISGALVYFMPILHAPLLGFWEVLTWLPSECFPAVESWSNKSSFPETTRIIFSYFSYSVIYYAVLLARHDKYRRSFLYVDTAFKRHMRPVLILLSFVPAVFLFLFSLPQEEQCRNLCVHESKLLQVVLAFLLSYCAAYALASLYWWLRYFPEIHFKE